MSGFNIEYGRGGFALLFIAEYGIILFFSAISATIICGQDSLSKVRGAGIIGLSF